MSSRLEDMILEKLDRFDVEDMKYVLSTPAGRRFVYTLVFKLCHHGQRCSDLNIKDGLAATKHQDFLDGLQESGRRLMWHVQEYCPELWLAAQAERISQVQQDVATKQKNKPKGGAR